MFVFIVTGCNSKIDPKELFNVISYIGKPDAEKAKKLIEQDPTLVNAKDKNGATPLHYGMILNSKELMDLVISKGADVNSKDKDGATPLINATEIGCKEAIESLISKGADVNAKGNGGTPLYIAVLFSGTDTNKYKELIEFLISKGADVNATSDSVLGITPLHWAPNKEIADLLISHGAKVNANNNPAHVTPLHYAVSSKKPSKDLVEFLISKGADVNAKDYQGQTPLDTAKKKGNTEITDILIKNGALENISTVDNKASNTNFIEEKSIPIKGLSKNALIKEFQSAKFLISYAEGKVIANKDDSGIFVCLYFEGDDVTYVLGSQALYTENNQEANEIHLRDLGYVLTQILGETYSEEAMNWLTNRKTLEKAINNSDGIEKVFGNNILGVSYISLKNGLSITYSIVSNETNTSNTIDNKRKNQINSSVVNDTPPMDILKQNYSAINNKNFEEAYNLRSKGGKGKYKSYDDFYKNWKNNITISLKEAEVLYQSKEKAKIKVRLYSEDNDEKSDKIIKAYYEGVIYLSKEEGQWKMDEANISSIDRILTPSAPASIPTEEQLISVPTEHSQKVSVPTKPPNNLTPVYEVELEDGRKVPVPTEPSNNPTPVIF